MKYFRLLAILLVLALTMTSLPVLAAEDAGAADAQASAVVGTLDAEYDGYIIKLRDDAVTTFSADFGAESLGFNMYLVEDEEEALSLAGARAVEYVAPNYRVELYGVTDITDEKYLDGTQWYLNGENGINITEAWGWSDETITTGGVTGKDVTVAVLDTGLYSGHSDFENTSILEGFNATNDGGTCEDVHWHGTAVTGIIAAGVNDVGIVGAAYGVNILPIRVFTFNQNGELYGDTASCIRGITYAVNNEADVINMSLGSSTKPTGANGNDPFDDAVQEALKAGVIVVAAAGNDGTNTLNYPAAYEGVIGVGAIDPSGTVASYSQRNERVWVSAPGSAILTTYSLYNTNTSEEDYYAKVDGTSFSSPCVAALAALARQYAEAHNQTLTPAEFANLLKLTAIDAGADGYDTSYGYGTVDAGKMLEGMAEETVTYDLNGGKWPDSEPVTAYIPYDDDPVELTSSVPVRDGYFFGGWYKNKEFSDSKVVSFIPADSSGTYYAKWIPDVTGLVSVTVTAGGIIYTAEKQEDGNWVVSLPAGTAIPTETDCVGIGYAYTGSESTLEYEITNNGDGPWIITVTQTTDGETNTVSYNLTVQSSSDRESTESSSGGSTSSGSAGAGVDTDTLGADDTEDGEDDASPEPIVFEDVSKDTWYYDAVQWAVQRQITSGTSATAFSPNDSCTRAQAVTFLWRMAGSPNVDGSNPFTDVSSSAYYYKAVLWAEQNGITSGTNSHEFSPDSVCQRSQIVAFLYRYAGLPSVNGDSSFIDVSPDSYYFNAVQWAVQNEITVGTGEGKFSPESTCIRAQIVAFLYRYVTG